MTLRDKLHRLQNLKTKNGWTGEHGYPRIIVYVPLKHSEAYGGTSYKVVISNGIIEFADEYNVPSVYEDILDQPIKSSEKNTNYEEVVIVTVKLFDDYLDSKVEKLKEAIPDPDKIFDDFEAESLAKMTESDIYKSADDDERKLIENIIVGSMRKLKSDYRHSSPEEILSATKLFLKYEKEAIWKIHEKHRTKDMTNREYMSSILQDNIVLASFLFFNAKKVIEKADCPMTIQLWLSDKYEFEDAK